MDPTQPDTARQDAAPAASPALRASDQERDQIASALGEALATGRLTSTEHAERIEAAYAAKTLGDLAPLTQDLPAVRTGAAPATIDHQQVAAVFSKVHRGGRWVTGRHTELRSAFGALIVDLSSAVLPGREIVLEVNAFCGKVIVTVPRNARIIDEGGVLFGKRTVAGGNNDDGDSDGDEDGPVIRVTGQVRFGKVIISRAGSGGRWPWRDGYSH
jgi:Domain of unknown function (DUF1707)/Cell wall-active antibiotics response 4TMS YvqF